MMRIITLLVLLCIGISLNAQTQYGWEQKSSMPAVGRHRSTALACGNRAYVGLGHINAVVDILYDDWWEYDPGTDSWSQKANFAGGLRYHASGFTIGNTMYVGTGRAPNSVLMTDFWKYDPSSNTWLTVASFPGAARRGAVGFEINGYGYVGTGSYYADFYKYNPVSNSWTAVAPLSTGRISAVGMSLNGKGYCGTGDVGGNSGDWWEYNPTANTWTQKTTYAGLPRMEATGFAFDGKCFVGTGDNYSSGINYQDFWAWNPATNAWIQVADFGGSARRYLVAVTLGARVYAGTGTSGINYNDWWEYGSLSSVEESNAANTAKVFPTPATDHVTFTFSVPIPETITCVIYDMLGNTVRVENFDPSNSFVLERNSLSSGMYTYAVTSNSKFIASGKLIFQ